MKFLIAILLMTATTLRAERYPEIILEIDFQLESDRTQVFWYSWLGNSELINRESRVFPEAFNFNALTLTVSSSCGFNFAERGPSVDAFFDNLTIDGICACRELIVTLEGLPEGEFDIAFPFYDQKRQLDQNLEIFQAQGSGSFNRALTTRMNTTVPSGSLSLPKIFFDSNGRDETRFKVMSPDAPIFLNGLAITLYKNEEPGDDDQAPPPPPPAALELISVDNMSNAISVGDTTEKYFCLASNSYGQYIGEFYADQSRCYYQRDGAARGSTSFSLIKKNAAYRWSDDRTNYMMARSNGEWVTPCLLSQWGKKYAGYMVPSGECKAIDADSYQVMDGTTFQLIK